MRKQVPCRIVATRRIDPGHPLDDEPIGEQDRGRRGRHPCIAELMPGDGGKLDAFDLLPTSYLRAMGPAFARCLHEGRLAASRFIEPFERYARRPVESSIGAERNEAADGQRERAVVARAVFEPADQSRFQAAASASEKPTEIQGTTRRVRCLARSTCPPTAAGNSEVKLCLTRLASMLPPARRSSLPVTQSTSNGVPSFLTGRTGRHSHTPAKMRSRPKVRLRAVRQSGDGARETDDRLLA